MVRVRRILGRRVSGNRGQSGAQPSDVAAYSACRMLLEVGVQGADIKADPIRPLSLVAHLPWLYLKLSFATMSKAQAMNSLRERRPELLPKRSAAVANGSALLVGGAAKFVLLGRPEPRNHPSFGFCGNPVRDSSAGDQCLALEVQRFEPTSSQDESSRLPALMILTPS